MKHFLNSAALVAVLCLSACSGENTQEVESVFSPNLYTMSSLRIFDGKTCKETGGNCLPDLVITAPRYPSERYVEPIPPSGDTPRGIDIPFDPSEYPFLINPNHRISHEEKQSFFEKYFDKRLAEHIGSEHIRVEHMVSGDRTMVILKNSAGEVLQVRPFIIKK